MSATKNFLYDLQEYVWLVEFAPITFRQRGKAIELMRCFLTDDGTREVQPETADWFDTAYELIEQDGGRDWATGLHAERLLSWVCSHNWAIEKDESFCLDCGINENQFRYQIATK